LGFSGFGEEWTAAQKEVWKTVEASYEIILKGDLEALEAFAVERSLAWWHYHQYPFRKEFANSNFRAWFSFNKPVSFDLKPIAISTVNFFAHCETPKKW
jgi:hypothetical protein